MICCFTGHREIEKNEAIKLQKALKQTVCALAAEGYTEFRAGGALGFDTLAASAVLELRKTAPCRLVLFLPCREQADRWPKKEREKWREIAEAADEVHFVSEHYHSSCMHMRNRALVEGSDCCVTYLTENRGGTCNTCVMALKAGLRFINLAEEL